MKKWNGSSWVNAVAKKWNGSSWVNATVKKWNGSAWVTVASSSTANTLNASWSSVYRSNNSKRTDLGTKLQQGQYKGDSTNGINRSLVGFSLSGYVGKDIKGIRLYLKSTDWYYATGGTVHIGWHNHSSSPSTFSHSKYSGVQGSFSAKVQEKWITMPQAFVDGVKNGTIKGISIYYNSADWHGYGRFHAHNGAYPPKLEITY